MKPAYWQEAPEFLRSYLGYMETVKGRSSKTIDEYFTDLRTFFRYMKRQRQTIPSNVEDSSISISDIDLDFVRTITLNDVYEYMNYAKNQRGNSNKTLARKATTLRVFFGYLTDKTHQLSYNPVQTLDTPKIKKSLPKYLTLEQCLELLTHIQGEFPERDYCMLTLLLNCGLRRAELAGLNLEDIGRDGTLRVRGKGNKERMLYLNTACRSAIQNYVKVRPVDGVQDKQALFLSRLKKRISLQGVHYIVKGYLKQIPGAENYSTHKLRHTAATLMYQQGGVDIRVLKDILGHENLGTTEIYTHLSTEQIRQAVESNPLSRVQKQPSSPSAPPHSPSSPLGPDPTDRQERKKT